MNQEIIISLDAFGGENAPCSVLGGAENFLKKNKNVKFLLFGNEDILNKEISKYSLLPNYCSIIHCQTVIGDTEKPSMALRKGKESSMRKAIDSVADKKSHAIISGGNTGALMAMSKLSLRTIAGIDRPAICSLFPTAKGVSVILDLGANIDCNSDNLVQFAIMGDAFAKAVLDLENPKIAILNVGIEDTKGSQIVKSAADDLKNGEYNINFCGYVEGHEIVEGNVDVIVTDGFTGNIALKTAEGTAKLCKDNIKKALVKNPIAFIGGLLAKSSFKKIFAQMDPRLHNGAMFVGLNGIAVKSHGSIDEIGFCNAIKVAYSLVKKDINKKISDEIIINSDNTVFL